ncbi:MAG: hypothetical protein KDE35_04230 [Geminicoccaceae bacterium]|nr:hypothetical protein [Geminicoccaceae bacterium]
MRLLRQRLEGPVREVLQESVRDPFVRIWCRWVRLVRRSEPFDALLDDLLAPLSRGTDSLTPSDAPLDAPPDSRNDTDGRSSPNAGRSALDRVRAGLARFCAGVSLELRCRVVHRFLGDDVIHRFLDENGRPHDGSRLGPMLAQRPRSDAEVRLWTRAVELIEGMVTLRSDPPSAAPTEHPSDPRSAPTRAAYRPELMPRTLDPD